MAAIWLVWKKNIIIVAIGPMDLVMLNRSYEEQGYEVKKDVWAIRRVDNATKRLVLTPTRAARSIRERSPTSRRKSSTWDRPFEVFSYKYDYFNPCGLFIIAMWGSGLNYVSHLWSLRESVRNQFLRSLIRIQCCPHYCFYRIRPILQAQTSNRILVRF